MGVGSRSNSREMYIHKEHRAEKEVLEIALKKVTEALDDLIDECYEMEGPSKQAVAKARGCLPKGYKNAYT